MLFSLKSRGQEFVFLSSRLILLLETFILLLKSFILFLESFIPVLETFKSMIILPLITAKKMYTYPNKSGEE